MPKQGSYLKVKKIKIFLNIWSGQMLYLFCNIKFKFSMKVMIKESSQQPLMD